MPTTPMNRFIQHLLAARGRDGAGLTDGELLIRFLSNRDDAALAALVRRHGPIVWGVCSRLLRSHHDAEDAFQATFLVLIQKAATLPDKETVGNWLYGVAHQTAVRMRAIVAKRGGREKQAAVLPEPATAEEFVWNDLQPVLDEELSRLPNKYRVLIVLCDLEGVTRREVARHLGIPEGTAATRLAAARAMLAKRLTRRGVCVSGVLIGTVLSQQSAWATVPTSVSSSTIKAATLVAAGHAVAGAISPTVAALTTGVIKAMFMTKIKAGVAVLLAVGLICGATGLGIFGGKAVAQPEPVKKEERAEGKQKPDAAKAEIRFAQLGQKRDQLITKFGEPKNATKFASGIESLEFQNGANRMLVEISPKTQQVIQIYYRKKTPFTEGQVMELLNRNTEGKHWIPAKESGVFIRSDGGIARGSGNGTTEKDAAKIGDEYQFAVLTGSEVMINNPGVATNRRIIVEDELKELEGF